MGSIQLIYLVQIGIFIVNLILYIIICKQDKKFCEVNVPIGLSIPLLILPLFGFLQIILTIVLLHLIITPREKLYSKYIEEQRNTNRAGDFYIKPVKKNITVEDKINALYEDKLKRDRDTYVDPFLYDGEC